MIKKEIIYKPPNIPEEIIFKDSQIIVINKPSGLLTIPGSRPEHKDSLLTRMKKKFIGTLLVHRLDMDTSGIIIFARTKTAQKEMSKQFEKREVKKTYLARIWGVPKHSKGTIELPIISDINNKPKQMICYKNGKSSITKWELRNTFFQNNNVLSDLIVKPITDNQFQIIAGERRWRACQLNGMHEVECVIKNLDDTDILEAALIENIQREDLNVIEEANAYKGLVDIKKVNNETLAKLIGKSASHVSNILRLLELDKEIQQMVINGDLSMGHARALIGVPDAISKANEIIEKKLSVRQIENITSEFKKNKKKKTSKDPNIIDLEKELSDKIGLKTSIQFNENGSSGSLTLYYSDLNQLDDLMKRLKK